MIHKTVDLLKVGFLAALTLSVTFPGPVQAAQAARIPSDAGPLCPDIACVIYTGDAYGPVHADAHSPAMDNYPVFGSPLVRAVRPSTYQQAIDGTVPSVNPPYSGFVLDGFGGLHPFNGNGSAVLTALQYPYFPGKDIARDLAFLTYRNGGGYVLDGYGGIHPFSDTFPNWGVRPLPDAPNQFAYFPGRDVAIKILMLPSETGGYVLDKFGGIHPFTFSNNPLPVTPSNYAYWPNAGMARDFWIAPGSNATAVSGYVLDAYGGIHPFSGGTAAVPPQITQHPYFAGHDIARAMWFMDPSGQMIGYELDGFGGIHPFADAANALPPAVTDHAYWPGQDIAKALFGARGNPLPPPA
jgi:hypothetical protein